MLALARCMLVHASTAHPLFLCLAPFIVVFFRSRVVGFYLGPPCVDPMVAMATLLLLQLVLAVQIIGRRHTDCSTGASICASICASTGATVETPE
jgi:hypothetical protein